MTSIHLSREQIRVDILGIVNSIGVIFYKYKLLGWKIQLIVRVCTFFDCLVGSRDHGA